MSHHSWPVPDYDDHFDGAQFSPLRQRISVPARAAGVVAPQNPTRSIRGHAGQVAIPDYDEVDSAPLIAPPSDLGPAVLPEPSPADLEPSSDPEGARCNVERLVEDLTDQGHEAAEDVAPASGNVLPELTVAAPTTQRGRRSRTPARKAPRPTRAEAERLRRSALLVPRPDVFRPPAQLVGRHRGRFTDELRTYRAST